MTSAGTFGALIFSPWVPLVVEVSIFDFGHYEREMMVQHGLAFSVVSSPLWQFVINRVHSAPE